MNGEHTFCRKCSSWFCPHVSAWMYEDDPGKAAAWDEPSASEESASPAVGPSDEGADEGVLWR